MKRLFWLTWLVLVVMLAACGPSEPVIEKAAADMNLTAAEVGETFRQEREDDLEAIQVLLVVDEPGSVKDASLRAFVDGAEDAGGTQVTAAVLRFDSTGSAEAGLNDILKGFQGALGEEPAALAQSLEEVEETSSGERFFGKAEIPEQEARLYLYLFRKRNVVGLIMVAGPAETLEKATIIDLHEKMDERIPLPVAAP